MSEKKIGRYTIKSELGRGGMATVYLAYDPVLERDVALKLLPNYFAHDPEFSARFEREAKTVAALEHGSIVSMYDYGEDGEWPYFVMRLMKGGSLKERIAEGPMSLEEAAKIIERVAGALDKAHSKEIVHRDLKPGNIMFDEDGAAYLGDFGIVKLAENTESYTRTGNTLGTPAYMSPEQADGKPDIDGRSDIYSLGIILYEMLTGSAPFTHDSMPRLLIMHLTAPIPNALDARPDLPAGVQDVIEKAMAKERDGRYATAAAFADALKAAMKGEQAVKSPAEPAAAPTRTAPAIDIEPEPEVVTKTAVTEPVAAPEPKPTPTQPPPAKKGIPTWAYAVAGVVVIAIIGIFALGGRGGDDDAAMPEPAGVDPVVGQVAEPVNEPVSEPTLPAATSPTEAPPTEQVVVVEPTTDPIEPTTPPDSNPAPDPGVVQAPISDSGSKFDPAFNYFDDLDGWTTEGLIESDEFVIARGQATFVTRIEGASWNTHDGVFGNGTYQIDVMMPDAKPLTAGFGMVFMFDDRHENWYEFYLDSDGRASANFCQSRCDDFESLIHNVESRAVNTQVGAMNRLKVDVFDDSMIFYVNDEKVGSTTNRKLPEGAIGLILFTDIDQDLKVVYDNFMFAPES